MLVYTVSYCLPDILIIRSTPTTAVVSVLTTPTVISLPTNRPSGKLYITAVVH